MNIEIETKTPFINYPDLNREVLNRDIKYIKLLRAWYVFRAYDKKFCNARGCFSKKDALMVLGEILGTQKSHNYQVLKDGINLFWAIAKHKDNQEYIHYFGIERIALIFGIKRYTEINSLLIEDCLLGDIYQVRANLYITGVGKTSSYTPLARETIKKYYHISETTQKRYEKIATMPMRKTPSYIIYDSAKNFEEALKSKQKLMAHAATNPNCVKLKRTSKNEFLILYQRGNLYSSVDARASYPSSIRKCNKKLKKIRRRFEMNEFSSPPSDHNDERLAGVLGDKDYQIYYFTESKSRGSYYNSVLKRDRYVYDTILQASLEHPYYAGHVALEDICLYKVEYCHETSPFQGAWQ